MSEHDPLMVALMQKLPAPGSAWPVDQRILWLDACEGVINLIYGPVEKKRAEIIFDWVEPPAAPDPKGGPVSQAEIDAAESLAASFQPSVDEEAATPAAESEERADEPAAGQQTAFETEPRDLVVDHVSADPPPKVEPPLVKNVGGRPSKNRPAGLPTNLTMATVALVALGGKASAPQIRDWVRKKYWPEMPDSWTSCLWDLNGAKRLARDGINFTLPPAEPPAATLKTLSAAIMARESKPAQPARAAARSNDPGRPVPHHGSGGGGDNLRPLPRPSLESGTVFAYGMASIVLSERENAIAVKLRAAMGKGHLAAEFLAQTVLGARRSNAADAESLLRDIASDMNPRLAELGLRIEFFKGFGFVMQEVPVGG